MSPQDITVSIEHVIQAFARAVDRNPAATAIVDDGNLISYRALDERSTALCSFLKHHRVGRNSIVPLAIERSTDLIVAILAVLKSGAAYMPIEFRYPASYVELMIDDSCPSLAFCSRATPDHIRDALESRNVWIQEVQPIRVPALTPAAPEDEEITPESAAYVMYTSGSTGRPKGVIVPHRAILRLVVDSAFARMDASQVWLHQSSPAFDASTLEIWAPLLNGGTCVISRETTLTIGGLRDAIGRQHITSAWITASLFNAIVDEEPGAFLGMQQVLCGGEVLSQQHVERAMRACPDVTFINGYGPTENTTFTCTQTIVPDDLVDAAGIPIGKPVDGTTVLVLDQNRRPVRQGEVGELCTGGAGVALGYLNRPELTVERFIEHDLAADPSPYLYCTGDLVRERDDGAFEFVGRTDRQVKLRGFRIELDEIEHHLKRVDGIADAVVTVKADAQAVDHLVAYIRTINAELPDVESTKRSLLCILPEYAIPRLFVPVDVFPTTVNGKLDERALPDPWTRKADRDTPKAEPSSEPERHLMLLWADVLGIESVSRSDDFLAIGGNSLHAMRLCARIQKEMGIRVGVGDLLTCRSLTEMSELISTRQSKALDISHRRIRRFDASADLPLSPEQRRLWLLCSLHPESPAFTICNVFRLTGPLAIDRLQQALRTLIERHDALRTRYFQINEVPRQRILPRVEFNLQSTDVSHIAADQRIAAAEKLIEEDARRPFDLNSPPLLRAHIVHIADADYLFALHLHHLVCDAWSIDLLLHELSVLYNGENTLSAPARFPDYLHERLQHANEEQDEADQFWARQLEGAHPTSLPAPLPGNDPDVSPTSSLVTTSISGNDFRTLVEHARQWRVTMQSLLLAAYVECLARHGASRDILIGTSMAGRDTPASERLVCFAVRDVPFRYLADPEETLRIRSQAIASVIRKSLDYYEAPLSRILKAAQKQGFCESRLFRIFYNFVDLTTSRFHLNAIEATSLRQPTPYGHFEFSLHAYQHGDCLRLDLPYNASRYTHEFANGFLSETRDLLLDAIRNSEGCFGELGPNKVSVTHQGSDGAADSTRIATSQAFRDEAPRDNLEAQITEIWQSLLPNRTPSSTDNFFAIGGDSLLAVRFLARMDRIHGIRISLAEFFEAPSIRDLASHLLSKDQYLKPRGVVTFKDGGAEPPLFLFAGLGGGPHGIARVARSMDYGGPVHAVAYPGFADSDDRFSDMTELARILRERIAPFNHNQPYRLLGFSFGGQVVFEIAHQLIDQDKDVDFLCLVDAFTPTAIRPKSRLRRLAVHLRGALARDATYRRHMWSRLRNAITYSRAADSERDSFERSPIDDVKEASKQASISHRLEPLDADALLITATQRPLWWDFVDILPDNGWTDLILGDLEIIELEANHLDLVRDAAADNLGRMITTYLCNRQAPTISVAVA